MSKEAIKEFYDFVQTKPDLQNQLNSLLNDREVMLAKAVEIGQQNNFSFTASELAEVIAELEASAEGAELSDEQLETVAGGQAKTFEYRGPKEPFQFRARW